MLGYFDNHQAAKSVPAGKVFEVLGFAADDRFVRIQVDGQIFEAFETDVTGRCETYSSDAERAANGRRGRRVAAVAAAASEAQ